MKTIAKFTCSLGAALGLTLASGCASSRHAQSAGEYIDSKTLNTRVKTALLADDQVKGTNVDVDVWKSVVQLNGFVETEEQKRRAEQIAWSTPGVQGVANNLLLKTDVPSSAAGTPAIAQSGDNRQVSSEVSTDDPNFLFAQVLANPSYFYGKSMEIEATVDSIIAANAFTVSSPRGENKPLLIMATPENVRNLTPGDTVRVRGSFNEFDKDRIEQRHNVQLADHKFKEFDGRPALTADDVNKRGEGNNRNVRD